ncbi:hypothetical protein GCM10011491_43180 [Brucella endophytica]|uniref:Uncharacterized protein n=1 Tax=Brucella endophytica TaxID=1963359 RepID=A0A916SP45_9HYPH|nr:hypothetical protein [Brucella endophytica]GGB10625.1 hypothetical protein GCM10011491_43180 [Brucella endophytica]
MSFGEFKLTPEQLSKLKEITKYGTANFADGYDYLRQQIQIFLDDPANANNPDRQAYQNTSYWLAKAAEINRNNPDSEANAFIRDITRSGLLFDGKAADPAKIQENSDAIANNVFKDVLKTSSIPGIERLLTQDVNTALRDGGQTLAGWGGSFYYWNMPLSQDPNDTVGNRILNDPLEHEKFIALTAKAVLDTAGRFGVSMEQALTALGAQAPDTVKAEILNRVADYLDGTSESLVGNPDAIDGYQASIGADGTISWYQLDKDLKRVDLTDPAKIAELNARRAVRIEKGANLEWQVPVPGADPIKLDGGITAEQPGPVLQEAAVNADAERIAAEQAEAEHKAAQDAAVKAEVERVAAELADVKRKDAEQAAANKAAREAAREAEHKAAQDAAVKAELERVAAELAEAERRDAEQAAVNKAAREAEHKAAVKAEAERAAAEQAEAERRAAEQASADNSTQEAARKDTAKQAAFADAERERQKNLQNWAEGIRRKQEEDYKRQQENHQKMLEQNQKAREELGKFTAGLNSQNGSQARHRNTGGSGIPGLTVGLRNPPIPADRPGGGGGSTSPWIGVPVVVDLNGDRVLDIVPLGPDSNEKANDITRSASSSPTVPTSAASPSFDWNDDGIPKATAWVGPNDGLLAIDLATDGRAGPDGKIDQAKEIAFSLWKTEEERQAENAAKGIDDSGRPNSDLEGLRRAFDSNGDDMLNANDARWAEFRIWQDYNQNGAAETGELRTLAEAGIRQIDLIPSPGGSKAFADGSAITGTTVAHRSDSTSMLVGDVALAYRPPVPAP